MAKTSSAMRRSGGNAGQNAEETETLSDMWKGETRFAGFAPSPLHPDGETVISKDDDGSYRYLGRVPNWTEMRVDKDSPEYKNRLKEYNINLTRHSDGSITVQKGGLYERQKNYKSKKEFLKDAEKRMNSRSYYDDIAFNSKVNGRLSQIEAELYKRIINTSTKSDALKKMNRHFKDSLHSALVRYQAGQDAKAKLKQLAANM